MLPDPMKEAREAIEKGDKNRARSLLRELILKDSSNELAWFTLAQVVEKRYQTIDCLVRVLRINPENLAARRALSLLIRNGKKSGAPGKGFVRSQGAEYEERREPGFKEPGLNQTDLTQGSELPPNQGRPAVNWPLVTGSLIFLAILLVAGFGPQFAPHDPLETSILLVVGEKYEVPPYSLLTPGYPLGSDGEGRDLLSRILWAFRPTMILVLVVASVRLLIGTFVGLVAGWSTSWPGRVLDGMIGIAISIPVIIVALCGIAAVGVDLGIWAFIIALSLTGWVETARVVRDQTQILRKQVYIEAAQSLGGTRSQILRWHVLRQVLSLLWMLFAFEISSTLLLVAALGFLGYYIGGDIWISVSDATAEAISGMPELGQMLATTPFSVTRPWHLIVIGGLVFIVVLGFNLLGEGLRRRTGPYEVRHRSLLGNFTSRAQLWADESLWWPLSNLGRKKEVRWFGLGFVVIAILISLIIYQVQELQGDDIQQVTSAYNQDHLWASARHDPYGTRWSQSTGPSDAQVRWIFSEQSGFSGGPSVAKDSTLYISTMDSRLIAIDPRGDVLWQTQLTGTPVGTPGLNGAGEIFVTDQEGGLTAVNQHGEIKWYFQPEEGVPATTGPLIDSKGHAYYVQSLKIQAVSADGDPLWRTQPAGDTAPTEIIKLSPEEKFLFWGAVVLKTEDGSVLSEKNLPPADRYFSGADGKAYLVDGHEVRAWEPGPAGPVSPDAITWDYQKYSVSKTSKDAGVTPDGFVWLFYTGFARGWGFGEDTRVLWLDRNSNLLGNVFHEIRNSQVIAVDQEARIYVCGNLEQGYGSPECQAFSPGGKEPLWKLVLEDSSQVLGGALVPGRLYIATQEGNLYAIGSEETGSLTEDLKGEIQREGTPIGKEEVLEMAGEPLGPSAPDAKKLFTEESGFSGGTAIAYDGTVYILSKVGILYAIDMQGNIIWQADLPAGGVGSPALGDQGQVYVVDKEGGLSAFSDHGELIWYYASDEMLRGIAGPAKSPADVIFYTLGTSSSANIQAVSRAGEPLWQAPVKTDLFYRSPELSSTAELVFFRDEIFSAEDGTPIEHGLQFKVDQFFPGQDGKDYLLADGTLATWIIDGDELVVSQERVLSPRGKPLDVGVTPEGVVWMLYPNESYWFTRDGQALGASELPRGWIDSAVGVDQDFTIYACGRDIPRFVGSHPACFALSLTIDEPRWMTILSGVYDDITGGSFAQGVIYFATEDGNLYQITEAPPGED